MSSQLPPPTFQQPLQGVIPPPNPKMSTIKPQQFAPPQQFAAPQFAPPQQFAASQFAPPPKFAASQSADSDEDEDDVEEESFSEDSDSEAEFFGDDSEDESSSDEEDFGFDEDDEDSEDEEEMPKPKKAAKRVAAKRVAPPMPIIGGSTVLPPTVGLQPTLAIGQQIPAAPVQLKLNLPTISTNTVNTTTSVPGLQPVVQKRVLPTLAGPVVGYPQAESSGSQIDLNALIEKMPGITITGGKIPDIIPADINDILIKESSESDEDFEARKQLCFKLANIPDYKLNNRTCVVLSSMLIMKAKIGQTYERDVEAALTYVTNLLLR